MICEIFVLGAGYRSFNSFQIYVYFGASVESRQANRQVKSGLRAAESQYLLVVAFSRAAQLREFAQVFCVSADTCKNRQNNYESKKRHAA